MTPVLLLLLPLQWRCQPLLLSQPSKEGVPSKQESLRWTALRHNATGHHHHLICVACGTVDDVEILPEYEIRVNELVDLIAQLAGFEPRAHDLEIEGRCAKCS